MRRTTGLVAAGLLSAVPAWLGAGAAWAAEQTQQVPVESSGWAWRKPTSVLPAPLGGSEPSTVPAGRLAVAADADPQGRPSKVTYLGFDLSALPPAAQVRSFTVRLALDPSARQVDGTGAALVACRPTAAFTPGEGTDLTKQPADDCDDAVEGEYDAEAQEWSFDLTAHARDWLAGPNTGVTIRPPAVPGQLFEAVLGGPDTVTADLVTEVAGEPAPAPLPAAEVPPLAPMPAAGPVASLGPVGAPVAPPLLPQPSEPQPVTAAPDTVEAAPAALPRPAVGQVRPWVSEAGLWVAVWLGALTLAAVSYAAGDTRRPLEFARAERRRLDAARGRAVPALVAARPVSAGAVPGQRGRVVQPARPVHSRHGRRPRPSASSTVT